MVKPNLFTRLFTHVTAVNSCKAQHVIFVFKTNIKKTLLNTRSISFPHVFVKI